MPIRTDRDISRLAGGRVRRGDGFTLVEVSIILSVLVVLGLILLPSLGSYLRDARLARARSDVASIHTAVLRFLEDTGEVVFRGVGNGNRETSEGLPSDPSNPDPYWTVEMLVSDGDMPDAGLVEDGWLWRRPVDGHAVDTLTNHLVQNTPGDQADARYRTPEDLQVGIPSRHFAFATQQGFGATFAWRGPYVSAPVRSDPWGNRYAVNVHHLDPVSNSATSDDVGNVYDVFVLSAGPDEEVDTYYRIDGVVPGDDDVIRVISGGSR